MLNELRARRAAPPLIFNNSKREKMAELAMEYIVVVVLGSVLLLLFVLFLLMGFILLKKKRRLCFRRTDGVPRPFVVPDKTLEERFKKAKAFSKGAPRVGEKAKPGKTKKKYSRLAESPDLHEPRGDPFAHNYLENPLVDDEEIVGEDWSNPVFDHEKSKNRDAAICIQSWFRMIR